MSDTHTTKTDGNANVALTDKLIREAVCPQDKAEIFLRDGKQAGLAARVRSSGGKAFVYLSTRPGMRGSHRITIGSFPRLKVADARKQAAILAGQRAAGVDLVAKKRKQKQEAVKAAKEAAGVVTLGMLIAEPKDGERDVCPYATSRRNVERICNWKFELSYLRKNLLVDHRNTDIREVSRRDITRAMNRLNTAGKRGAAAGLWKHAHSFFAWACEQGFVGVNPLTGARRKRAGSRASRLELEQKGRALDDGEIVKVWHAAGRMGSFGLLVKFCLAAGTRRGEAARLQWHHVLSDRVVIAPEITKMGKPHAVPLTALLSEVLADAQQFRRASNDYIFPSSRTNGRISGFSTMPDRLVRAAGVNRFCMHDLRRTTRSTMGRLGISKELQRAAVGQQPNALDGKYDKYDYWDERCAAFKAYHHHVASLLGGNVISFEDRAQAVAAG